MNVNGDVRFPDSGVVVSGSGVLYGATSTRGAGNLGAVFSLTPPSVPGGAWTEAMLASFGKHSASGWNPQGRLCEKARLARISHISSPLCETVECIAGADVDSSPENRRRGEDVFVEAV
jgi:hypothetical protein